MSTSPQHAARTTQTSRTSRSRKGALVALTVAGATTVTGCSIGAADIPALVVGALVPYESCDDLRDQLVEAVEGQVGPYGLEGGYGMPFAFGGVDTLESADAPTSAESSSGLRAGDGGSSTTNNQEAGVDEADLVKNDGEHIYTISGDVLRISRVVDGRPDVVAELDLELQDESSGYGGDALGWDMMYAPSATMLLDGGRVLVVAQGWAPYDDEGVITEPDDSRAAMDAMYGPVGTPTTTLVSVDVSDVTAPRETARMEITGSHVAARETDGTARVVVTDAPRLPFTSPDQVLGEGWSGWSDGWDDDEWREAERAAEARNEEVLAASTVEQWLPTYTLTAGGSTRSGPLVQCDEVAHPQEFAGASTASVVTLPMDLSAVDAEPATATVVGAASTVYMSTDRAYLSTVRYDGGGWISDPEAYTAVHAFDVSGDGVAQYAGSGEVPGETIGQYAFSEHEGVLRVATTQQRWSGDEPSTSRVTTLVEEGGELVQLGVVDGLGETEQIYSVRYLGDTAYVVTFRQTDPLYVIDLSDPRQPKVTGELKITGYSSYLHPVADGRLLGVGQEATTEGRTIGLQVSLFDTSDPATPDKLDSLMIENAWADAEWNPLAFLWWEETGQVMLPMSGEESGLLVATVTDGSVVEDGLVEAADGLGYEDWRGPPLRSLVLAGELVLVWHDGLQVTDLETLETTGSVEFSAR